MRVLRSTSRYRNAFQEHWQYLIISADSANGSSNASFQFIHSYLKPVGACGLKSAHAALIIVWTIWGGFAPVFARMQYLLTFFFLIWVKVLNIASAVCCAHCKVVYVSEYNWATMASGYFSVRVLTTRLLFARSNSFELWTLLPAQCFRRGQVHHTLGFSRGINRTMRR